MSLSIATNSLCFDSPPGNENWNVHVNVGLVWQTATNVVNILMNGTYFIELSAAFVPDGEVRLLKNKASILRLVYGRSTASEIMIRSAKGMFELGAGDVLKYTVASGCVYNGRYDPILSRFLGFLIYPS